MNHPNMARVLTISVLPIPRKRKGEGPSAAKFLDGQRKLANAMAYLAKAGRKANREAISFLSEHFRTKFRITDRPES